MDIQNHFYGHTAALAAYAGLPAPRHVAGLIQHGWTTQPPIPLNFADFPDVERSGHRHLFVWSHSSRAWAAAKSARRSFPLGAPWAYLASIPAVSTQMTSPAAGTLILPVHSSRIVHIHGDQGALAASFAASEGPSTVCLHDDDLTKPEVVAQWRAAGHELVTAGPRHDPQFLGRIAGLIARHGRVVSNRLITPIMYAASVGREVGVYGDPLSLGAADVDPMSAIRDRWPELHGESATGDLVREIARDELGFGHVMAAADLVRILGWGVPASGHGARRRGLRSMGPAYDYWAGAPVRKALNVLGIGRRDVEAASNVGGASPMAWLRHPLSHLPKLLPREATVVDPLPAALPVA